MISHRYRLISCRSTVKTADPTYRRVGAACLLGSVGSQTADASRLAEEKDKATAEGKGRRGGGWWGPKSPPARGGVGSRLEENRQMGVRAAPATTVGLLKIC